MWGRVVGAGHEGRASLAHSLHGDTRQDMSLFAVQGEVQARVEHKEGSGLTLGVGQLNAFLRFGAKPAGQV